MKIISASGAPSPTLPTEGEGVCCWIWQDRAQNSIGNSPLVGEDGRGDESPDPT
jgi:hypothetical protein